MPSRSCQLRLRRAIAAGHGSKIVDSLATAARFFMIGYENTDWDPTSNGEDRLLRVTSSCMESPTVFDVGANLGDWTAACLERHPTAQTHAFELVEAVAAKLTERYALDPRVTVHPFGLSSLERHVTIGYDPDRSTLSRIIDDPSTQGGDSSPRTSGLVRVGDDVMDECGVASIDLLKSDAEGTDLEVLHGFTRHIHANKIRLIQFEHGRVSLLRRVLLADFYALLEPAGYTIGKVYPRYINFQPYDSSLHESGLGFNYVAVHRSDVSLIERLSERT